MADGQPRPLANSLERLGRICVDLVEEFGYYLALCVECIYWLGWGALRRQPVRIAATVQQMVDIGLAGLPIIFMLSFAIGVMLATQGIHTLKQFGAQTQVVLGIALSLSCRPLFLKYLKIGFGTLKLFVHRLNVLLFKRSPGVECRKANHRRRIVGSNLRQK